MGLIIQVLEGSLSIIIKSLIIKNHNLSKLFITKKIRNFKNF
jgi:hypothetical protein